MTNEQIVLRFLATILGVFAGLLLVSLIIVAAAGVKAAWMYLTTGTFL